LKKFCLLVKENSFASKAKSKKRKASKKPKAQDKTAQAFSFKT